MTNPDLSKTRPEISATFGLKAGNKYTADTESSQASQRKITDDYVLAQMSLPITWAENKMYKRIKLAYGFRRATGDEE